ncbi:hypothetical protein NPIL_642341 [Nephila pilipes]|uniref:Uncharacterized protein n=1 Tax=Nephila pilipes TaxID=299642 RepID=A0A8X6PM56_NEPPI|nr:hypothetical protein NPIL_522161 [Nephila pilipes]GFU31387.1 hypothetical protein NPIL_642341 [Nephila pilipes]
MYQFVDNNGRPPNLSGALQKGRGGGKEGKIAESDDWHRKVLNCHFSTNGQLVSHTHLVRDRLIAVCISGGGGHRLAYGMSRRLMTCGQGLSCEP